MQCAFCRSKCEKFEWSETSQFGKRAICHNCICEQDKRKMNEGKPIILYKDGGRLVNRCKCLSFKIIEEELRGNMTICSFLWQKKRWCGKMLEGSEMVWCNRCETKKTAKNKS